MAALDVRTDLFDLFGQEGTCTICMETLRDGDRVRAIHGCDHLFHQSCVEPWLLSRGTCPMCRAQVVPVQQAPAALRLTTDALERLQTAIQTMNPAATTGVRPVLAQIQTLLRQAQTNLDARKRELAYVLGLGIASRFTTAAEFNTVREALRTRFENREFQFEGISPSPLIFTNRAAFMNSYRPYGPRQSELARIRQLTARLHQARDSSQFLQDYWRRG